MGSRIPKSECAFKMPSRRKEERSQSSNARGGQMCRRKKSEVRSKSQTKEKQELSSNCGGRKDTDSIAVFTGTIADQQQLCLRYPKAAHV